MRLNRVLGERRFSWTSKRRHWQIRRPQISPRQQSQYGSSHVTPGFPCRPTRRLSVLRRRDSSRGLRDRQSGLPHSWRPPGHGPACLRCGSPLCGQRTPRGLALATTTRFIGVCQAPRPAACATALRCAKLARSLRRVGMDIAIVTAGMGACRRVIEQSANRHDKGV